MLEFTLINSELRKISNDKMTLKYLIINYLRSHLSFVIFAFTLSFQYLKWFLGSLVSPVFDYLSKINISRTNLTPLGRVFKIGKRLYKILSFFVVDKGMIKWVTPLGVTH